MSRYYFQSSSTTVDEKTWTEIKKDFQGNFVVTGGGDSGTILNRQMKEYASKGEPLTDPTLFENGIRVLKARRQPMTQTLLWWILL